MAGPGTGKSVLEDTVHNRLQPNSECFWSVVSATHSPHTLHSPCLKSDSSQANILALSHQYHPRSMFKTVRPHLPSQPIADYRLKLIDNLLHSRSTISQLVTVQTTSRTKYSKHFQTSVAAIKVSYLLKSSLSRCTIHYVTGFFHQCNCCKALILFTVWN